MNEARKKLLEHVFITLPTMVGVAYFVLWACAPPAALPPPVPMTGTPTMNPQPAGLTQEKTPRTVTGEIGIGAMVGVDSLSPEGGGWSWLSAHIDGQSGSVDLGVVASAQFILEGGAAAGGGYLRVMKKRPSNTQFGVELSGGAFWGRIAFPYMTQRTKNSWLYLSPGATVSLASDVQLPVGIAIETGRLGVVRLEGGAALRISDGFFPAAYVAFSGSLRFGRAMRGQKQPNPYQDVLPLAPILPSTLPLCVPCTNVVVPNTQPASAPSSMPTSAP